VSTHTRTSFTQTGPSFKLSTTTTYLTPLSSKGNVAFATISQHETHYPAWLVGGGLLLVALVFFFAFRARRAS
jgi:hypothetical protein